jgi:hypothetical protein
MATAFVLPLAVLALYLARKVVVSVWAVYLPLFIHYCGWDPYLWFHSFIGFASTPIPAHTYAILVWPAFGLVWLICVLVSQECNDRQTAGKRAPQALNGD